MPIRPEPPEAAAASWRRRLLDLVEFRPRETVALAVLCLALVAGAAFAYARSLPKGAPRGLASPIAPAPPAPSATASGGVVVHMAGAVRSPGVYSLAPGARVIDGVRAAGGAAPDADLSSINLARLLTDGERVYVPRRGETPPPDAGGGGAPAADGGGAPGAAAGGKVNINTASVGELDGLPGIGPVLAQRIVDYRTQHGPFRSVNDLQKVEGIGQKKFESLKDFVTV
jgi:competence protein ComEA